MKGHLTIHKVANGEEELVYDEDNVITSGFGWSLSYLYGLVNTRSITDFQIDRFQLGVSGSIANQVSSTYQLSGPLSAISDYDTNGDSNLQLLEEKIYTGNLGTSPSALFAKIPFSKVTKIDDRSVRYTIFIDEDSCNNFTLNEIALFVKNPTGNTVDEISAMAAYRYFSNISKTSDFGLVFRWTITFG
jgi:hypothetical protein